MILILIGAAVSVIALRQAYLLGRSDATEDYTDMRVMHAYTSAKAEWYGKGIQDAVEAQGGAYSPAYMVGFNVAAGRCLRFYGGDVHDSQFH